MHLLSLSRPERTCADVAWVSDPGCGSVCENYSYINLEKFKMKCIPIATALLAISLAGNALTLGKAKGSVIVGRPLDLVVSIQAADDEAAMASCFNAEVFYGDFRQEAQRVSVMETPTSQESTTRQIRITASSPVNEPVVTVWVSANCGQKTKRRFVFFADVESILDAVDPASPSSRPKTTPHGIPVQPENISPSNQKIAAPPAAAVAQQPTATPYPALPPAEKSPSAKPKVKPAPAARGNPKSVQRKEAPKEPSPEAVLAKRVDALDEWQASNLAPESIRQRSEQLRLLEGEMKALREVAQKNQTALNNVNAKLLATQQSSPTTLITLLGILSIVLAGVVAFLLFRLRANTAQGSAWWGESAALTKDMLPQTSSHVPVPASPEPVVSAEHSKNAGPISAAAQNTGTDNAWSADIDIDLDFGELADTVGGESSILTNDLDDPTYLADQSRVTSTNAVATENAPRALNLREMMDVRQQAEFYMTLGQHDEAIQVLTATIEGDGNVNPLVYLDLLKILHTLSRKSSFDQYKVEFNRLFSGLVPDYPAFTEAGRALESYADICDEIVRRWPSMDALVFIENQLVKHPHDANATLFELDAYRDLLMLHGVLKRLGGEAESDFAPFSAPKNSELSTLTPNGAELSLPPELPADAFLTSPIEIDFDLSEQETKPGQILPPESPPTNLIDFDLSDLPKTGSK